MNKIILKLISEKRKKWEFPIALFAFFLGIIILQLSLQFNFDMNRIFHSQLRKEKQPDYIMINKKLGREQMVVLENHGFEGRPCRLLEPGAKIAPATGTYQDAILIALFIPHGRTQLFLPGQNQLHCAAFFPRGYPAVKDYG